MATPESKLRKHLKQRIEFCADWKMNEEVHVADRIYANGKQKAFEEIIDFLDEKYFINEKGELNRFN